MGVKGLRSVLDSDRRLYSTRWVCDDHDVIFIDAPALMHHLLISCWDMIFLDGFYVRAKRFIVQLAKAGCREVYLVMEGMAGAEKDEEHLKRFNKKVFSCDEYAKYLIRRSHGSVSKINRNVEIVPHLLTEQTLVEAFRDACQEINDMKDMSTTKNLSSSSNFCGEVLFAVGEAESFISIVIESKFNFNTEKKRCIIFSNDTDFMIYSSSPGFVALNTIEITEVNACVSGIFFSKDMLCSAFQLPSCVLPIVAVLSGSDYVFQSAERKLEVIRQRILNSAESKLRKREKNNPSSKIILLSVMRYISYIVTKMNIENPFDPDLILSHTAINVAGHGKGKDERLNVFNDLFYTVMSSYGYIGGKTELVSSTSGAASGAQSCFWVDVERLRKRQIFYGKPVLERVTQTVNHEQLTHSTWQSKRLCDFRRRLYRILLGKSGKGMVTEIYSGKGKGLNVHNISFDLEGNNIAYESALEAISYCLGYEFGAFSLSFERIPIDLKPLFIAGLLINQKRDRFLLGWLYSLSRKLSRLNAMTDMPNGVELELDAKRINSLALLQVALTHTSVLAESFRPSFQLRCNFILFTKDSISKSFKLIENNEKNLDNAFDSSLEMSTLWREWEVLLSMSS